MPKNKPKKVIREPFGERMARLRMDAGYTQRDLAAELGVSQRMVAYYEKETDYPPTHLLPSLAKLLGVTSDALLGIEATKRNGKQRDSRLWRRFTQIEKLDTKEKRQIIQYLDTFIERERLKKKATA